jgi:hypothetical protein
MAIFEFTDSDLMRNKVVEPAWYVLDIQGHRDWTPSKAGDSNNCFFECVIEKNADNGDTTYAGVPVEVMLNDKPKARGFIEAWLRGLGVDVQSKQRYNGEAAVGRKIEAFIENDTYNGRLVNKINHKYRMHRG